MSTCRPRLEQPQEQVQHWGGAGQDMRRWVLVQPQKHMDWKDCQRGKDKA